MQIFQNRKRVGLAAFIAVALMAGTYGMYWNATASDAGRTIDEAFDVGTAHGDDIAATVNGEPITMERVVRAEVSADVFPLPEGVAPTAEGILDMLIEIELLFQEATRRGLVPPDEDVTEQIRIQQEQFAVLRQDGELSESTQALLDGLARAGYPVEEWDTNAEIFALFVRSAAVAALASDEASDVEDPWQRPQIGGERLKVLAETLRTEADIEVHLN